MYGNLLNNDQIIKLVENHIIQITPFFEKQRVQIAQYPLTVSLVCEPRVNVNKAILHAFEDGKSFTFSPNEYVVVEVAEQVKLSEGIVGRFIPSSNLIEQGLMLTAGKIEYPFGQQNERIHFGLKNALNSPIDLPANETLAYIEFFDLRGLANRPTSLTERDKEVFSRRYPLGHDGDIKYE